MSVVAVLPVVYAPAGLRCLASMAPDLRASTVVVDNTEAGMNWDSDRHLPIEQYVRHGGNLGVASSWNLGRQRALETDSWLLLLSAAVEFGPAGGGDLLEWLGTPDPVLWRYVRRTPTCGRVPLRRKITKFGVPCRGAVGMGWHCFAIHPAVLHDVGMFDPIFWPAYFEDTDYLYRMGLAGWPSPRENEGVFDYLEVDALDHGTAHGMIDGGVSVRMGDIHQLYIDKWGGQQGEERFTHPYGVPRFSYDHTGGPTR